MNEEIVKLFKRIRVEQMKDQDPELPDYAEAIPEVVLLGLLSYVDRGQTPGHFLTCVLQNDLFGAIGRADKENQKALPVLIQFIYNQLPGLCWGSREKVEKWVEERYAERARVVQSQASA